MALHSDKQIANLKPKEGVKITKIKDINNLYLWIKANKTKHWWFRYYVKGKEKGFSLGVFPAVGLVEARRKATEYLELKAKGVDLKEYRNAKLIAEGKKSNNSFEIVAREWFKVKMAERAESHKSRVIRSLEKDAFPIIGDKPIDQITPADVLAVVKSVEARGARETAHRIAGRCISVFDYAIVTSRATINPATTVKKALAPVKEQHFAAVVDPLKIGGFLKQFEAYTGSSIVRASLPLAPLLFVRPGELRNAEWEDIDLDRAEWSFIASKTKESHIVPLARQVVEMLQEVRRYTGDSKYVFHSLTSKLRPLSNNAVLGAYRRMGISKEELTEHGWRATARTVLDEVLRFPPDMIEQQLAHRVKGPLGRAYNRTKHLSARKIMMQNWADFLDELKATDNPDVDALAEKYKYKP